MAELVLPEGVVQRDLGGVGNGLIRTNLEIHASRAHLGKRLRGLPIESGRTWVFLPAALVDSDLMLDPGRIESGVFMTDERHHRATVEWVGRCLAAATSGRARYLVSEWWMLDDGEGFDEGARLLDGRAMEVASAGDEVETIKRTLRTGSYPTVAMISEVAAGVLDLSPGAVLDRAGLEILCADVVAIIAMAFDETGYIVWESPPARAGTASGANSL